MLGYPSQRRSLRQILPLRDVPDVPEPQLRTGPGRNGPPRGGKRPAATAPAAVGISGNARRSAAAPRLTAAALAALIWPGPASAGNDSINNILTPQPTNVRATGQDGGVRLDWTPPSSLGNIEHYQVRISHIAGARVSSNWVTTGRNNPRQTLYVFTGLNNCTPYSVQIRSRSESHDVSSDPITVTTTPMPAWVETPGRFTAGSGDKYVRLGWDPPGRPQGQQTRTKKFCVNKWEYSYNSGDSWTTIPSTSPDLEQFIVTGLTNGTKYKWTVRASNDRATSPKTPVLQTTPIARSVPGAPTGLTAKGGNTMAELSWTAPAGEITGWDVSNDGGRTWHAINGSDSETTSHDHYGLTNGTEYTFKVRAKNTRGAGRASNAAKATPGKPTLTISDAESNEGSPLTFSATLNTAGVPAPAFTATLVYTDVTATKNDDYTPYTQTLSFDGSDGQSKAFNIQALEDSNSNEGNETFTVGATVSSTAIQATDTGTGSIIDARARITIADAAAEEGDSITFTATLDKDIGDAIIVTPLFSGGTATKDTDYTPAAAFRMDGTAGSATFTVATVEDSEIEPDETFTVTLTTADNAVGAGSATGTIRNDDAPSLTIADSSAVEGDSITFTVTLDRPTDARFTATPSYTDGSAAAGTDYTENTAGIQFAGTAGETKTFTVETVDDSDTAEQTFTVGLTASAAGVRTDDTATGTIRPDTTPILSVRAASATEGSPVVFTLALAGAYEGGFTATPGCEDVSAKSHSGDKDNPKDYSCPTGTVTFAGTDGETKTMSAPTLTDELDEGDETFYLRPSLSVGVAVVKVRGGLGTIKNKKPPTPTVTVSDANAPEGDKMEFTLTLDRAVPGGFSVKPKYTDVTAAAGADYAAGTGAIEFEGKAGETEKLTVQTKEDTEKEGNETFTVGLSLSAPIDGLRRLETPETPETPRAPKTPKVILTDTGTGTIKDNESADAALSITGGTSTEGKQVSFTITLDQAVPGGFRVVPTYPSTGSDTAVKGEDYTANTAEILFAGNRGESKTFLVQTKDDDDPEGPEKFKVGMQVKQATAAIDASATADGTITDNDMPTLTIEDASASEGSAITFQIRLSHDVPGGVKARPSFTDGTAKSTAQGRDYTQNTAEVTFAGEANETQDFTVATTDDATEEPDETFTVSLSASGDVVSADTAVGTIVDNDSQSARPALTIADATAEEGGNLTFTVTLDKAVPGGVRAVPAFRDGTASQRHEEAPEEAQAAWRWREIGAGLGGGNGGWGDPPGEGGAVIQSIAGDYIPWTGTLNFAGTPGETKTFIVATADDTLIENTETFTVSLAPPAASKDARRLTRRGALSGIPGTGGVSISRASASSVVMTDTATGTITDNDTPAPRLTIGDASAEEGGKIAFQIDLDRPVAGGFKVTAHYTDGTATNAVDYTRNSGGIEFDGTVNERTSLVVDTIEDAVSEADETFTVSLTVSGTATAIDSSDTAVGTITNDDKPAVTVADASAVEGGSITFTLELDAAFSGGFEITPSYADGTATNATDYTRNTTVITFDGTAGETKTLTVATVEDTAEESDETFTLSLSSNKTGVNASDTATGTINDDDASPPEITINDATAEEGQNLTFTATLNKAVSGKVRAAPAFRDGTAKGGDEEEEAAATWRWREVQPGGDVSIQTGGEDFIRWNGTLVFNGTAGETKTFTVATVDDTVEESTETFTVSLSVPASSTTSVRARTAAGSSNAAAPGSVVMTDTATGTITDNDAPDPALTIEDAAAAEGGSLAFTITLDRAVAGGLTATASYTDGTATNGTDYTRNTAGVAFAGNKGESKTLTVQTVDDAAEEPDETFTVALSVSGTSETVTATDTAVGTIADNDAPDPKLTVSDAASTEGAGLVFNLVLDKAVAGGFTVTPTYTDGTATSGTDYTRNTNAVSFAGTAGESKLITVQTADDADDEEDETFTMGASVSGASVTVDASDTGTGTIEDDDEIIQKGDEETAVVTVGDAWADEGGSMTFAISVDIAVAGGFTLTPSYTDGTAEAGADYTPDSAGIAFNGDAGETRTLTVQTLDDSLHEQDETFTVSVSPSGTAAQMDAGDTGTGTITDDDEAPADPVITISDAAAEEGDAMAFTVTLAGDAPGGFTLTPGYTDGSASSGTDYTPNTDPIRFAGTDGETHALTVQTVEDEAAENDETFILRMSPSDSAVDVSDDGAGTILDDDTPAPSLALSGGTASEGDAITFTATLSGDVAGGFSVTPLYTDGAASSESDYTRNSDAVEFEGRSGESRTFSVQTTEDDIEEDDEDFSARLSVRGTPEAVGPGASATGTIVDDDDPEPKLTVEDASAAESGGLTFTVSLDRDADAGFDVTPAYTDVTAAEGEDYTANTAPLRFEGKRGESRTFTVAVSDDEEDEQDETFVVRLVVTGTRELIDSRDTATGTIHDNDSPKDPPAPAKLTISGATAVEGAAMTFTATLNAEVEGGFTATPEYTDGTAGADDYTKNTAAIAFAGERGETKAFTVQTADDAVEEDDETFAVRLAVSGTKAEVDAGARGVGTIVDDDEPAPVLSLHGGSAAEGGLITFTASLDRAVPGGFTATPEYTDATAARGDDYTPNNARIRFSGARGETRTFAVRTIDDDEHEEQETFSVSLRVSGAGRAVASAGAAVGAIIDDDHVTPTLWIDGAEVEEGGTAVITLELDGPGAGAFTATPVYSDGTAAAGADYTRNTSAVSFSGNDGETRTLAIRTTDDHVEEEAETFTVTFRLDSARNIDTDGAGAVTIVDNDAPPPVITITGASASEGETLTFSVNVDRAVPGGFTATPAYAAGTAGEDDYTPETRPIRFVGAADETRTFTVAAAEDALKEATESFTVSVDVSGTDADIDDSASAEGEIADATPDPVLTVGDAWAEEGSAMTFTVVLDRAIYAGFTVFPEFEDGTAAQGADYTAPTGGIAFEGTAGESRSFTVETTEDSAVEGDESFAVGLRISAPDLPIDRSDEASGRIRDDDEAPAGGVLSLNMHPKMLLENGGPEPIHVGIELEEPAGPGGVEVRVHIGAAHDNCTAEDYHAADLITLLVPEGMTEAESRVLISPVDDNVVEGDEFITMTAHAERYNTDSDRLTMLDEEQGRVRAEGAERTLFLIARAVAGEAVNAVTERLQPGGRRDAADLGAGAAAARRPGDAGLRGGPGMFMQTGRGLGPQSAEDRYRAAAMQLRALGGGDPHDPLASSAWLHGARASAAFGGGGPGGQAGWSAWARTGAVRTSMASAGGGRARGDLFTVHAGVDGPVGRSGLAGAAVSRSAGRLGYTVAALDGEPVSGAEPGAAEGAVTSVQPYFQWRPSDGFSAWAMAGAGGGSLDIADAGATARVGVRLALAAGGFDKALPAAGLALRADAVRARLTADESDWAGAAAADASRGRLLIAWTKQWSPGPAATYTQTLEGGGRWDGGSHARGFGAEVSARWSATYEPLGLEASGGVRYLAAHQAEGFDEWGASASIRMGPGVAGAGPVASFDPEWGAASPRMQGMWAENADPSLYHAASGAGGPDPTRISAGAGYRWAEPSMEIKLNLSRDRWSASEPARMGVHGGLMMSW